MLGLFFQVGIIDFKKEPTRRFDHDMHISLSQSLDVSVWNQQLVPLLTFKSSTHQQNLHFLSNPINQDHFICLR